MPYFLTDQISISTDGKSFGSLDVIEVDGALFAVVETQDDSFTVVQLDRAHIRDLPEDAWDGPLTTWYAAEGRRGKGCRGQGQPAAVELGLKMRLGAATSLPLLNL